MKKLHPTKESLTMKDGTQAWLSQSKRYYVRREPSSDKWTKIVYFDLKRNHIPLAKGTCSKCGDTIESQHCGDFVMCKCKKSFVDVDRWMPEHGRYGGLLANTIHNNENNNKNRKRFWRRLWKFINIRRRV